MIDPEDLHTIIEELQQRVAQLEQDVIDLEDAACAVGGRQIEAQQEVYSKVRKRNDGANAETAG